MDKVDPKVDEAIETLNMKDGPTRRKLIKGTGLVSATAAASALLAACSSSSSTAAAAKATAGNFPSVPSWQFWFVNHVTTNTFFVPTQYGFADAAALLHLPTPKWTGSTASVASQMVSAINAAVAAKASGIATTLINSTSFTTPVASAMSAGIPVLSYNADGTGQQDRRRGHRHQQALLRRPGAVHLRPAARREDQDARPHPESRRHLHRHARERRNIQPRYDGAASVLTPLGYTRRRDRDQRGHVSGTGEREGLPARATRASRVRSPWTPDRRRSSARR